ncbi:MAG: 2-amino-4-hydroxy-6-hydroxymethyldihydropteridine diphosphokinase [Oligoflexia bacterium]|nr:2-amino-4-hydroxy-6-hydroxymethyldihydropteridine diphosphokinase [Oligoflexia bacterium]
MEIIISTGSNLGDRTKNLTLALEELKKNFNLRAQSRIYKSDPVYSDGNGDGDGEYYLDQPFFYNQVLEFCLPDCSHTPQKIMEKLLKIEDFIGRKRNRNKNGDVIKEARVIDIDFIFFGQTKSSDPFVTLPHPRWHERNFVLLPLMELPYFQVLLKQKFLSTKEGLMEIEKISATAKGNAVPIS